MKRVSCLILSAALLAALLAGCGGPAETPAPSLDVTQVPDDIIETPNPTPGEPPAVTPVPENPAAAERDPQTELCLTVEGQEETVRMTLVSGEFAGGPAVSLYLDESRYVWSETDDGACLAAPPTPAGAEPDCALELRFVPGKDADDLAPGLLDGYDDIRALDDEGTVDFAGGRARLVQGSGSLGQWRSWIIELPEGAVTLVLRYAPEMAEGHAVRLSAAADTVRIVSRY